MDEYIAIGAVTGGIVVSLVGYAMCQWCEMASGYRHADLDKKICEEEKAIQIRQFLIEKQTKRIDALETLWQEHRARRALPPPPPINHNTYYPRYF